VAEEQHRDKMFEKENLAESGELQEYLGTRTRNMRIATHLYPSGSCARAQCVSGERSEESESYDFSGGPIYPALCG
jgi:hypothetical protein